MIYGIGTDIVRIERMAENIDKYGDKFARRILSEHEFSEFINKKNKAHFLAKRFAAKEATAKAMGTGFISGLKLSDISVEHTELGKPYLVYYGRATEFVNENGIKESYLSIADEIDHAVAFVTLEY
ncbi:Holo-[acyl-carrier-protein] synthase [hydrothermal vent metagenome]|uniref:Holo-[acyl-carrier-protein] synthase n=1 Tax=hydrothermal vent metagenome TaxID=652676 RepID=A0A3B1AI30_9ZZZZ